MVVPDTHPGGGVWQEEITLAGEGLMLIFVQHQHNTSYCW